MSNPFADPHHQQGMDSNPFADPTVQQGLHSSAHEYGEDADYEAATTKTPAAATGSAPVDMQSRFQDLERREQELRSREAQLTAKAEHIRKHGRNNWPPGPFPLIYHDINEEIPAEHQSTVLTLYRLWMFLILTLTVNLVAAILLLISQGGHTKLTLSAVVRVPRPSANNGGADLAAGIMYLPVIGALSFFLWYRPAYNAYMKGSAMFFYMYFLFAGFHLAFSAYMIIGIPSSGSAGIINLISRFATGHLVAGIFCALATACWVLQGLGSLWMYKQVYAHSAGEQGHTFSEAKQEISMYGLKACKQHSPSSRGYYPNCIGLIVLFGFVVDLFNSNKVPNQPNQGP
ncbi:BZ3500_MvSof-1268-A1-R1_Chr4-4g07499 [Microbotryum saponariae]|uniref:BZ3500_MvSof-1268-A1-R1_Chr4-4g07499 protein n=1 Tax=Microbotryum saponariae TaxID=289078 RepID=A0A2X0LP37_9BASI|nr:BZ3500_MvSof-1268-A1-R1_Chr4-4g07499 [Microbotryum saponariae]SDA07160.1 BZ3501_MvSof-1269-A2-R1_Chr4-3g07207 [Microbotryum saponariae]